MPAAPSLTQPAPSRFAANVACIASTLIWSAGFPLADALLAVLPPLPIAALRLGLAAAFLMPVWLLAGGRAELSRVNWPRGLAVGAVGLGLTAVLLVYAQMKTDGVTTAVIVATLPVAGIALECLLDGRRLTGRLVLGMALSVGGAIAVYGARMGEITPGLGALAAFASVLTYAWGSRASVSALPGLGATGRTAVTLAGGALFVITAQTAAGALGFGTMPWERIGAREWTQAAAYGIGSVAIAHLLFLRGINGLGIGIASMHINIAPFYVMLFALAAGEPWSWPQLAALGLVILGVTVAQSRPRTHPRTKAPGAR